MAKNKSKILLKSDPPVAPKWTVFYDETGTVQHVMPPGSSSAAQSLECEVDPVVINQYGVKIKQIVDDVLVDRPANDIQTENTAAATQRLRRQRDKKLDKTDFTQSSDVPLSLQQKSEWAVYRQALRDLPENTEDPTNVEWPTPPLSMIIKGVNDA